MNHPGTNSVVCVLGMHRSGTSCLVGSLQKAALQQLGLPSLADDARFYNSMLKSFESNDLSIIPRKYRTLYKNLKAISL